MSGMVNTIVKNNFEVDLNFYPIRVIRFRNSDPAITMEMLLAQNKLYFQVEVLLSEPLQTII